MKETLRGLQSALLRQLGARLAEHGFTQRPRSQSFERAFDGGRASIHLAFIEHDADFDVTVDVAIRFDAVEDLVHVGNTLLSKKEQAQTFTLGVELGNLENGKPTRWAVRTDADVAPAADGTYENVVRVGLPYLSRYAQLDAACELLSSDERPAWLHSPIHAERAKRACAMLVVANRREELSALASKKSAFLQTLRDPGAPLFQKFVSRLQTS